ncbi:isochorismatase family protein [Kaistia dalseonensis]|uniref:Nicotinamidase-related amidase n=1 Tax=Kaistia dalseonensis TaxID=410840 RepID=A0ABU0H5A5_9HYPH|nr:isochorismatase family protein [Kaistia dalseonensis]MCX5494474.1 isochorismatase family protein [Kaistia dalseonensis]MDQ0437053.1 nicotinamidase-related amidase [Kaistia dalseonensis]
MQTSSMTAREMYEALKANPVHPPFGFGEKPILVNVDFQKAYTAVGQFATAYETDPHQIDHVNRLAAMFREQGLPVVWTYVGYVASGEDCGVFGSTGEGPDALKNVKLGEARAEFDDRLVIEHGRDIIYNKKMPSAFHETPLQSLAVWHRCDTVIVTGGSTSGCVRATVVDALSRGYRTIVPEECVADLHESPHFANLYDMMKKYADVLPVADVYAHLAARQG